MKKVFVSFLSLLLLVSCDMFEVNRQSYVQGYREYGTVLTLDIGADGIITASAQYSGRFATIISTGEDKVWFDTLCEKYADTSYKSTQKKGYKGQYEFLPQCLTPDLMSIDVTANAALFPDHPAGSSLADRMQITLHSVYDYVQAGYPEDNSSIRKQLLLSDLSTQDLMMLESMEHIFSLSFIEIPTIVSTPVTLTVKCIDDNGRVIIGTIQLSAE